MSNAAHGGQLRAIASRFGLDPATLLDFSASLNPAGPPLGVAQHLQRILALDARILTEYPDLTEQDLRASIAHYAGAEADQVVVANGFVPLLEAALRARPLHRCLLPVPSFSEYPRVLAAARVDVVSHALHQAEHFRYDRSELCATIRQQRCDSILLANPQNPAGVMLERDSMLALVAELGREHVTVLLDEAFIDYAPHHSLARDVEQHRNLIVFRSVTKFFALAGLRVAYAVAHRKLAADISAACAPWAITTLAAQGVMAAVADSAYTLATLVQNKAARMRLQSAFDELRIAIYPGAANFLLLRLPAGVDAGRIWQSLIVQHGIVLRHCESFAGLEPGHLRCAVCNDADNERLVQGLRDSLEAHEPAR